MKKTAFALFLVFTVLVASVNTSAGSVIIPAPKSLSSEPDSATMKTAIEEFKNLSKKERKARIKEAKKEIRKYKRSAHKGEASENTVLMAILCILLPPLAVYLHEGEINTRFWISLLLTILFWIPGVIYALIVVFG
jgi:uncharacterized membrane protein YqaE (UPF0057 family)